MAAFDDTRVQAPDIADPERLRPPSAPGDTFGGAPRAPIDNRLTDLASALGQFNSELGQFGHAYSVSQRYHKQTGEIDAAKQYVATKTPDEFAADAKSGRLPQFATPQAQTFMGVTEGAYAAHSLANDVAGKVSTGELKWGDGSAQSYLDNQRNSILQQHGWDPSSYQARGFGQAYNELWQKAGTQGVNAAATAENDRLRQTATAQIEMAVDVAQKAKLDPAATWQKIDEARRTAITYGHYEPKELDPMVFDALNRRMATDPNWVMGVGNQARTDLNDPSQTVPPLFSKAEYLSQAQNMAQRTQTYNVQAAVEAQKADIKNGVSTIFNSNNPAAIHNVPEKITAVNPVDNSAIEVPKSTVLAQAASERISADNKRIALGQATKPQVQDEQLNTFAPAGVKQQQWSDTLNGAAHSASATTLTQPAQQANMKDAYQLYSDLRAKNPAYLNTLMDEKSKQFFNTAYIQQTLFNRDPVTAMQASAKIWGTPKTEEENRALADQRRTLENTGNSLGWGGWLDKKVRNPEIGRDAMVDAAWSLVRLNGMKPEDAIKQARDIALDHFVPVNGSLVPDLHYLPKEQMKPAAEGYLKDWATGPAASLKLDPKNLSIMPTGPGQFVITDANSGMPIVSPGHGYSYVTVPDLVGSARKVQAEAAAARATETDKAAQEAAKAIPGAVSDELNPGAALRRQRPNEFKDPFGFTK